MKKTMLLLTFIILNSHNTYSSENTTPVETLTTIQTTDQITFELKTVTDSELIDLLKPQLDPDHKYFFQSNNGSKEAELINGVIQLHNEKNKTTTYFEQVPSLHKQLYQETEVPPLLKKDGSFSKQCFIITGFLIDLSQKK